MTKVYAVLRTNRTSSLRYKKDVGTRFRRYGDLDLDPLLAKNETQRQFINSNTIE